MKELAGSAMPRHPQSEEQAEDAENSSHRFVALTWNQCGKERSAVFDAISVFERKLWDAILNQEGLFCAKGGVFVF